MRKNIITLCVLGLVSLAWGQANDTQPARSCNAPGTICATCDTVAVCIDTGDGYMTLHQDCQTNERCVGGLCVPGALCNYRPFTCSDEGYYPDPYDCRKYHICLPSAPGALTPVSFECPSPSSYNASSQDCSSSSLSPACIDRPVPECLSRLQIGPIPGDNNLYYICIERDNNIAPELRRCPGGRMFDAMTMSCVDSSSKKDKKKKKTNLNGDMTRGAPGGTTALWPPACLPLIVWLRLRPQ